MVRTQTEKQEIIDRIVANFPKELRDLNQWVAWRVEERNGKPTKVPYNARTDGMAMSDNPGTWTSFDVASVAFLNNARYDGVGYMFSEFDPYTGIDFDNCMINGEMDAGKLAWLRSLDSYSEYSPSKNGTHTIVIGVLPDGGRKSNQHSIEMYDNRRFFTVTGDKLPNAPAAVEQRQEQLTALHAIVFPPKEASVNRGPAVASADIPHDDRDLLERMFASRTGPLIQSLWNGDTSAHNGDESAADQALCNYLAFWTGKDAERMDRLFRQSGLFREKWDRNARTGETYGAGTIDRAIRDTNNTYAPGTYRNGTNGNGGGTSNGMAAHSVVMNGNGVHHSNGQVVADNTLTGSSAATPLPSRNIDPLKYRAEDGGIMDAWLDHYGDEWMFVVGPDAWHFWNKTHWAVDRDLFVKCQVVDLMDGMNRQCSDIMKEAPAKIKGISAKYAAAGLEIPDTALKEIERIKTDAGVAKTMHMATKRSSARVSSVESMSRSKCGVSVDKLNIDDSLNLANGVLSLASLELRDHDRNDLFTYCLDYEYDPAAKCPTWERAVGEWLVREGTADTDPELVLLFQELVGYSLTPDVKRGVMAWMFGEGSNGKSVAIHVIKSLLGPMAMPIDFQTVGQPGNYDLADIPGKRVLLSTESERGKTMSEKYIKMIVTGDPLKARPIYGSPIDFSSTAKIWWAMNDKPVIKDTTDSMWRRMKLIPFYRKFTEGDSADVDLPKKLEAELPGILNWAIDGLIRLTINGRFTTSTASEDAKQQYREEANPVAQWVNTMTVRTSHPATLQSSLFKEYVMWCRDQNEYTVTATQFGKDLKRLKIDCSRKTAGWMYNLALVDGVNRV